MLAVCTTTIAPSDTAATLQARLAELGAELVVDSLRGLAQGPLPGRPQPDVGVTYAAKIAKAESVIDWRDRAAVIERRLRAFDPFPGARSELEGEVITCWRGEVRPRAGRPSAARPGEVLAVDDGALTVACGDAALRVTELQRPGGRRLPATEFLRGRAPRVGAVFAAKKVDSRPGI
jgi:methionyl-tRNA formyltransferase